MVSFNLNVINGFTMALGLIGLVTPFDRYLGPLRPIGKLIAVGAIGLGAADAFGAVSWTSAMGFLPQNQIFSWSSGYAGAYQVAAKNLPYDPNNYYLPPRDRSIAP